MDKTYGLVVELVDIMCAGCVTLPCFLSTSHTLPFKITWLFGIFTAVSLSNIVFNGYLFLNEE